MARKDEVDPWERPDIVETAQRLGMNPRDFWNYKQRDPVTRESPNASTYFLPHGRIDPSILTEIEQKERRGRY